ncbi:MAG: 3-dehydro-L-gulonate 2-dehydrogenase [Thalassobius sp.]|nr:3-dehydro-L-gulonate 2-dehydrogenase [Thalassovita sp.]
MLRVSFDEMFETFTSILLNYGFTKEKASLSARLFTETSLDGVYSHGLNRFPRFINTIKSGHVKPENDPVKVKELGNVEVWDGQAGPGNTNAHFCMNRAMEIAADKGLSMLALKNTNHWMRGGAFGWQAANNGFIGICWTNTKPNMPAWGASENVIGNNPLIIAIPKKGGHLVLDMAMSLFSFGKIELYKRKNEELPFIGGYNNKGELTKNAAEIEQSELAMPIGYWKGAGLSLMLDLLAALLSGGNTTTDIGKHQEEAGLSQMFMAIDLKKISSPDFIEAKLEEVIKHLHSVSTFKEEDKVYYPGERTLLTRKQNTEKGIPVDEGYWQKVLDLK